MHIHIKTSEWIASSSKFALEKYLIHKSSRIFPDVHYLYIYCNQIYRNMRQVVTEELASSFYRLKRPKLHFLAIMRCISLQETKRNTNPWCKKLWNSQSTYIRPWSFWNFCTQDSFGSNVKLLLRPFSTILWIVLVHSPYWGYAVQTKDEQACLLFTTLYATSWNSKATGRFSSQQLSATSINWL